MKSPRRFSALCWFALSPALAFAEEAPLAGRTLRGEHTALDRYVAAPDPSYKYELANTITSGGCTVHVLRLTSQAWLTAAEVDRPVWQHWLSIITPPEVAHQTGLLFIAGETKKRSEDSLVAYTWNKHLRTGDEKWPARLPMTKAAVRAMDTMTEFCASADGGKHTVGSFFVMGRAKRGWTTSSSRPTRPAITSTPCPG